MPVAIAPIDRELWPVTLQFFFERGDQYAVLFVDGTLAAEVMVVLCNFEHPLARNIAPAQHVFEERNDVVRLLRTAEGQDHYGVVARFSHETLSCQTEPLAYGDTLSVAGGPHTPPPHSTTLTVGPFTLWGRR